MEVTDEDVEKAAKAIHGGRGCTCRLGAKGDARAALEAVIPGVVQRRTAEAREIERLHAWKQEALVVMDGLQELGRALDLPLGSLVTGERALAEVKRLRELLREVAGAGVTFDDARVGYVEVQINRVTWDELKELKDR